MYGNTNNVLWAPNGTRIETPQTIYDRTSRLNPQAKAFNDIYSEHAAQTGQYATALTSAGLGGARPAGMGYTFGDSWARTQRGVMEFSLPVGQIATIDMAMRFSVENSFVAKALHLKTLFTTKGIQNTSADDKANDFLDQVIKQLRLLRIFKDAVSMYYSVGLVPFILPEPGKPLDWIQIWDPRYVRTVTNYGKTSMFLVPDDKMMAAVNDPTGRSNVMHKLYYDAMPSKWKTQLLPENRQNLVKLGGTGCLTIEDGSYIIIENRHAAFDRHGGSWDGCPLQPYFAACENYRMLMAGDYATSFLMKNIVALVSVGDPKAEGQNYLRADDTVLNGLQQTIQTPDQAMYVYGDPTFNIRYITPDPNALANEKYKESKETLKNLLPGPFWHSEGATSFADATVELQWLEEEAVACQNTFDDQFWTPIYERAAEGRSRLAKKNLKPPSYDRSALRDRAADLQAQTSLYNSGGLDIKTLIGLHGHDPEEIVQKLKDQYPDAKKGFYSPAFESKQGIVAAKTYGLNKFGPQSADGGKGGRPKVPGSKPQAESQTGRAPRKK